MASFAAASYLLNTRTLMALTDAAQTDPKTKARIQFAVEQWAAAVAPSNFLAFNAEAQKKAIETQGESIAKGMQNLLKDMQQGHVSMTDESVFEVGKNVATSEGKVVFENDYFQLLEYKPLTGKVYERPFLLIPPCINKFYILDLQPTNSFIRYAVSEGHRTFVVSWRNPDASMSYTTWDDLHFPCGHQSHPCGARNFWRRTNQCLGLLRRGHHFVNGIRCVGRTRRTPCIQCHLAHHLGGLPETLGC
jgi:polyhydroxyalkanoate synthase